MAVLLGGCFGPDPRSMEGALDMAARAIEQDDSEMLFKVVDQRARHAMHSIVKDRHRAKAVIDARYPAGEREQALAALGDAAAAPTPAALFASRCARACRAELGAKIGAPVERRRRGEEWLVRTSRGATLHMYAGSDTWWGIVWKTAELSAERDRASQELAQIRDNAAIYERRRALESRP